MGYNIGPTIAVKGEKEYASAMKNIKQQMGYVKAEAGAMTSAYSANDKSVAALTSRINGLKQAQSVQTQAVKAAEDALQRMRAQGVDPSSKAYKDMEANLNNAKTALNKTNVELDQNKESLKKSTQNAEKFRAAMGNVADVAGKAVVGAAKAAATAIVAIGTATIAAGAALFSMAKKAGEAADALITLSVQTGVSMQTLQEWGYAARFIDTEVESMTKGLARTVMAMKTAVKSGKDSLTLSKGLTVSMKDANGELKTSEAMFYDVVDALGAMTNETEREIAAQSIFGKSYQEMQPLIKAGSAALNEYAEEARKLGLVLSDEDVAALGAFDDAMQTVNAQVDVLGKRISLIFLPAIQSAVESVSEFIGVVVTALSDGFQDSDIKTIGEYISAKIADGMKGVSEYLPTIVATVGDALNQIAELVVEILPTVLPVFTQAGLDLLMALVDTFAANAPALGGMITEIVGQFGVFLMEAAPALVTAFAGIITSIAEKIPGLITQLAASFKENMPLFVQAFIDLFTGLVEAMPDIVVALAEAAPVIITALVDGLVDALPALIDGSVAMVLALVDAMPEIIQGLVDAIPAIVESLADALVANVPALTAGAIEMTAALVMALPQIVLALLQAIPGIVKSLIDGFKSGWGAAREAAKGYVDKIKDGITERWSTLVNAVKGFIDNWIKGIADAFKAMVDVGRGIVDGIWKGISAGWEWLKSSVSKLVDGLVGGVKKVLGINSPSKVFAGIGSNMALGIGQGFERAMQSVSDDMQDAIPTVGMVSGARNYSNVVINVSNPSQEFIDSMFKRFNVQLGVQLG